MKVLGPILVAKDCRDPTMGRRIGQHQAYKHPLGLENLVERRRRGRARLRCESHGLLRSIRTERSYHICSGIRSL
jgi:hypothetical protein